MSQITPKMILDYDWGSYKGFFVENYVAQAFLVSGKSKLYSWQEKTAEVEFLHEEDGFQFQLKSSRDGLNRQRVLRYFPINITRLIISFLAPIIPQLKIVCGVILST